MKKLAIGGALVFLVVGLIGGALLVRNALTPTDPCPASYQSNPQEAEEALNSTVSIVVVVAQPAPTYFYVARGLGIAVPDGYILTAAHVVKEAHSLGSRDTEIWVTGLGSFSRRMAVPAVLAYYNEVDDVALLDLRSRTSPYEGGRPQALRVFGGSKLSVGTPICVFSVGHGFLRGTIVLNPFERIDPKSWFASEFNGVLITPGSSGGAIYARADGKLEIVGIIHRLETVPKNGELRNGALSTDIVEAIKLINAENPGLLKVKPVH